MLPNTWNSKNNPAVNVAGELKQTYKSLYLVSGFILFLPCVVQAWIGHGQEMNLHLSFLLFHGSLEWSLQDFRKKIIQLSESIIHWLIIDRLIFGPINLFLYPVRAYCKFYTKH